MTVACGMERLGFMSQIDLADHCPAPAGDTARPVQRRLHRRRPTGHPGAADLLDGVVERQRAVTPDVQHGTFAAGFRADSRHARSALYDRRAHDATNRRPTSPAIGSFFL